MVSGKGLETIVISEKGLEKIVISGKGLEKMQSLEIIASLIFYRLCIFSRPPIRSAASSCLFLFQALYLLKLFPVPLGDPPLPPYAPGGGGGDGVPYCIVYCIP